MFMVAVMHELSSIFTLSNCGSKMDTDQCIHTPPGINYIFFQRENQTNTVTLDWYQITAGTSPSVHLMYMKQRSTAIYGYASVCRCIISQTIIWEWPA